MKKVHWILILMLLQMWCTHVSAQSTCDTNRALSGGEASLTAAVARSLGIASVSAVNCNAFVAVISQLVKNKPRAGSQLKAAAGPDTAAAAGEIASLRSDPAQAAALEAIQKEPDPLMRSMLEASQFHAAGLYSARDLRLDEARRLAGVK